MNTTSLAKSMNGALSVTDGEITIEGGQITFSDGSVLDSIGDIALKSADNTFTGINTFNNTLITTDISNNGSLKVNGLINDLTIGRWGYNSIIFGESATARTGDFNTIIGTNTFKVNTTGVANTALGHSNLRLNTTGDANTALGGGVLYANTTGTYNSGVGFGTLNVNTIGEKNSSIGYYSGGNQKTGNNNTFLGSNTKVASLSGTYNNSTAIGYNSSIDASNQIVMGTTTEYVKIPSITASTAYTDGALVVSGGVGIAGNLRVNGRCIFNDIFSVNNYGYFSTDLLVNGNFTTNGALDVSGASVFKSNVSITSTTSSTLPTNGALVVSGGVGVAGALIVDGPLRTTYNSGSGATNYFMKEGFTATWNVCSGTGEVDFINTTPDATFVVDTGFRFFTNVVGELFSKLASQNSWYCDINPSVSIFKSGLSITSTTASSLPTNGALVVNGGVGIGADLNVGDIITSIGGISLSSGIPAIKNKRIALYDNNPAETDPTNTTNFYGFGINNATLRFQVAEATSFHRFYCSATLNLEVGNGIIKIHPTTTSTSSTSGALQVLGGAGIAENLNVGGMIKSVNNTNNKKIVLFDSGTGDAPSSATNFYGFGINTSTLRYQVSASTQYHRFYCGSTLNLDVGNGIIKIPTTTTSTSSNSGALQVVGGVGIAENLNVGGFVKVGGLLTVATINSAQMFNEDAGYTVGGTTGTLFTFASGIKIINISFSLFATAVGAKTMTLQLLDNAGAELQSFTQTFYFNQTGVHLGWSFSYKTANLTSATGFKAKIVISPSVSADLNDYLNMTMFNLANNS